MTFEPWIEHDKRRGTFVVRWRDLNGRKFSDSYRYDTKADARVRRAIVRRTLIDTSLGKVDLTRTASVCAQAYFDYLEKRNMFSLYVVKSAILRFIRVQQIGALGDITRQKLMAYHDSLYTDDLAGWTILRYMGNVRAWLRWCVDKEWLAISPFAGIRLEKPRPVERFFTDDELLALERAIPDPEFLCILRLGYMCGLRPGEMRRLERSNILWDAATQTGELAITRDEAKTDTGGRIVPLPVEVYNLLANMGDRPLENWSRLKIIRYFWKVKARAKIQDKVVRGRKVIKTLYWTRHTYAKRYLENGGRLSVLKDRMGHASITITSDVYGHMERSSIKDVVVPSIYEEKLARPAFAPQ